MAIISTICTPMRVAGYPDRDENARPEILEVAKSHHYHDAQSVITYMEGIVMADIKLIALDLDGTLLTSDRRFLTAI